MESVYSAHMDITSILQANVERYPQLAQISIPWLLSVNNVTVDTSLMIKNSVSSVQQMESLILTANSGKMENVFLVHWEPISILMVNANFTMLIVKNLTLEQTDANNAILDSLWIN